MIKTIAEIIAKAVVSELEPKIVEIRDAAVVAVINASTEVLKLADRNGDGKVDLNDLSTVLDPNVVVGTIKDVLDKFGK